LQVSGVVGLAFAPHSRHLERGSAASLPEIWERSRNKLGKRWRAQIIQNQFEKINHIKFRIIKFICSIAYLPT
jgi:hypothetical protein